MSAPESWVPTASDSPFPITNLPYAATEEGIVVAIGDSALDLSRAAAALDSPHASVLDASNLDVLLAAGPAVWAEVRAEVTRWLTDATMRAVVEPHLRPLDEVRLVLGFTVADYVDFYASERHARNLGRILRPGQEPLLPNWRRLPVGYHGRSGTVVVSGTEVVRPCGQLGPNSFGPTQRLDIEAEVGFVVGVGSSQGAPVAIDNFDRHVFGVCLVNDWSARDIQAWEYRPLGPFLGKSFATSVSPWVVPLAALSSARVPVASSSADTPLLPYLREHQPWGLDLALSVAVNGGVVSHPTYRSMHWSPAQMLAHLTVNGASLRTGDLYASGTVSGESSDTWGSLIELYDNARFLDDGDEVVITATAPGTGGTTIGFGEVRGRISPAVHRG